MVEGDDGSVDPRTGRCPGAEVEIRAAEGDGLAEVFGDVAGPVLRGLSGDSANGAIKILRPGTGRAGNGGIEVALLDGGDQIF